jgi:hypothetical protein
MGTMLAGWPGRLRARWPGAAALAVGVAAMVACDEVVGIDGGLGPETVAGHWMGEAGIDSVLVTLQQPDSATVTGFGVFYGPQAAQAFRVEGLRDRTRINLLLEISVPGASQTGSVLAHYRGEFRGGNRIEGTLAGGGYANTPMVLHRERRGGL